MHRRLHRFRRIFDRSLEVGERLRVPFLHVHRRLVLELLLGHCAQIAADSVAVFLARWHHRSDVGRYDSQGLDRGAPIYKKQKFNVGIKG